MQQQGVEFEEDFAPVARLDTVRLIPALVAQHGWEVHHLDVKSAFLNGDLQEEVYVVQFEGFVIVTTLNFHISRVATNVSCSYLMQNKNLRMHLFISGKI